MGGAIAIFVFFVVMWGLGFSATYFSTKSSNFLERNLMNLGIGLGVFAILSIILNFLRIPLDWKIFLLISLVVPAYYLYKHKPKFSMKSWRVTKKDITIILAVIITLVALYMYLTGAFAYPYLENEDPWGHSEGVKYVALEKTAFDPPIVDNSKERNINLVFSYIDPYPPAYDILLGVFHQLTTNVTWTMKVFNALIISLGILWFFFLANLLIGNRNKALFATFSIAAIPGFFSHFIWAHSLVVVLFFPTMYAFLKMKEDRKWAFVGALMVAGIWVSQNLSQPIKLSTMILLYLIVVSVVNRKLFKRGFYALGGGMLLSFFWWIPMINKYTFLGFVKLWQPNFGAGSGESVGAEVSLNIIQKGFSFLTSFMHAITNPGGSSARAYTLKDFISVTSENMINSPVGLGLVVSILALIGLVFVLWKYKFSLVKKENLWVLVILFWFVYTFWGVNGETFPISIAKASFRMWMLLAIPVSILAAEGAYSISRFFRNKNFQKIILLLLFVGIIFTSGVAKYEFNTAVWPTSSAFSNIQEAFAYGQWFETIPDNTKVFLYVRRPKIVIGFGKYSCNWCQDDISFRNEILYKDATELHKFLSEREYEYLIINPTSDPRQFSKVFGQEDTQKFLPIRYQEMLETSLFTPVHNWNNALIVLKVNKK